MRLSIAAVARSGTVDGNTASEHGGGVWIAGSCVVTRGTFSANHADILGGGLVAEDLYAYAPLEVDDSVFTANDAPLGGGLYLFVDTVLTGVEVTDNTAQEGAGVTVDLGDTTLDGATVVRNAATLTSGGAWVITGTLTATGSDFGAGIDDNGPSDVGAGFTATEYLGYEAGASFTCDGFAGTCTPAP